MSTIDGHQRTANSAGVGRLARRPAFALTVVAAVETLLMGALLPFRGVTSMERGGQMVVTSTYYDFFWTAMALWHLLLAGACAVAAVLFVRGNVGSARNLIRVVAVLGLFPNVPLGVLAFAAWKVSAADESHSVR